jgi:hypothetical protein
MKKRLEICLDLPLSMLIYKKCNLKNLVGLVIVDVTYEKKESSDTFFSPGNRIFSINEFSYYKFYDIANMEIVLTEQQEKDITDFLSLHDRIIKEEGKL